VAKAEKRLSGATTSGLEIMSVVGGKRNVKLSHVYWKDIYWWQSRPVSGYLLSYKHSLRNIVKETTSK